MVTFDTLAMWNFAQNLLMYLGLITFQRGPEKIVCEPCRCDGSVITLVLVVGTSLIGFSYICYSGYKHGNPAFARTCISTYLLVMAWLNKPEHRKRGSNGGKRRDFGPKAKIFENSEEIPEK